MINLLSGESKEEQLQFLSSETPMNIEIEGFSRMGGHKRVLSEEPGFKNTARAQDEQTARG